MITENLSNLIIHRFKTKEQYERALAEGKIDEFAICLTPEPGDITWDDITEYADNAANAVKNDLLNGAGEAYDTLKELGNLINENTTALDALSEVATNKADKEYVNTQLEKVNICTNQSLTDQEKESARTNIGAQKKITGTAGQFVVIGDDGNVTTRSIVIAEEVAY